MYKLQRHKIEELDQKTECFAFSAPLRGADETDGAFQLRRKPNTTVFAPPFVRPGSPIPHAALVEFQC